MTPDRFIDDVASAMTDIEAPPDFRARVLAKLEPAPSRRWRLAITPVAAAAVAAILFVNVAHRRPANIPPAAVPQPVATNTSRGSSLLIDVTLPVKRTVKPEFSADERAWLARAVPALKTPAVVIDSIQPAPLSIAPIDIEALTLDPILVTPVGGGTSR